MVSAVHLHQNDIHIWRVALSDIKPADESAYALSLSDKEIQRAQSFIFKPDQRRFALGRGLLRYLLSTYLDISPKEVVISYKQGGKPIVLEKALQFNVSHTGDYIVYAFTRRHEVGVDVEQVKPRDDFLRIAERFFTAAEHAELKALPSEAQTSAFYRLWVCKEALIKTLGEGLLFPLSQCEIDFMTNPVRLRSLKGDTLSIKDWYLSLLDVWEGCQAALAVQGKSDFKVVYQTLQHVLPIQV